MCFCYETENGDDFQGLKTFASHFTLGGFSLGISWRKINHLSKVFIKHQEPNDEVSF